MPTGLLDPRIPGSLWDPLWAQLCFFGEPSWDPSGLSRLKMGPHPWGNEGPIGGHTILWYQAPARLRTPLHEIV